MIARTDDWVLEEGRYGPRMVLTAAWSEVAARAWESRGARELELNYAKGWRRGDLSFLTELPKLAALSIIEWNLEDASVVNELSSLRYLTLFTYCGTELRFDRLPELEECAIEWRPKARSLFGHQGIKKLFVDRLDAGGDLRPLAGMTSLRALTLKGPRLTTLEESRILPAWSSSRSAWPGSSRASSHWKPGRVWSGSSSRPAGTYATSLPSVPCTGSGSSCWETWATSSPSVPCRD